MDAPHWWTLDALVGPCATLHSAMDEVASEAPPTSTEESSSDSDEPPGLEYGGWSSEEDGGDEMDVDEEMGEAGEVHVADTEWWAAKLRTWKSSTKEDADRDYSWTCGACTFQNAQGMWQCEMCSRRKPGTNSA